MTVRELLLKIDSKELSEWIAFYKIEPFGGEIEDFRSARMAAMFANVNRGKGKRPYDVREFQFVKEVVKVQPWRLMKKMLMRFVDSFKEDG